MKTLQKTFAFFAIILLMLSCDTVTTTEETTESAIPVRVMETSVGTVPQNLEFTGVVQPYEEAHIAPGAPARIDRILVDVGDRVQKGQLLVQMDHTQLHQARVQLDNLKTELARLDTLLKAGAVTQQSYDQLKTQYEVAKSNIDNLETHTQVRSTLNGVVTARYYSEGEMFTGAPGIAGKPAIVTLNQVQPVKVMIGVSERFWSQVSKGQTARVTSEVFPDREFTGRVSKKFPVIDRTSGTFQVEILIDNRDEALRPGMFTRVDLHLGMHEALLVPALAVMKQAGSNERYVFVVDENKAQRLTVHPGRNYGDKVEVTSGLKPGKTLVISGQHNLMQGSVVKIVD